MFNRKRRDFVRLVGGAAAWPFAARAQQSGRLIRLGFLGPTPNNPATTVPYEAFRTALAEGGFREGQNLIILLRHKRLGLEYLRFVAAQHGHRGRPLTRAMISLWRMVAMEFGMCRSGRNGGSSGSITVGYGKLRAQRGGTRS